MKRNNKHLSDLWKLTTILKYVQLCTQWKKRKKLEQEQILNNQIYPNLVENINLNNEEIYEPQEK